MRKIFELGRTIKNPVNLSIGQPHFPVPGADPRRRSCRHRGRATLGYTLTQGIPELRDKIKSWLDREYHQPGREVPPAHGRHQQGAAPRAVCDRRSRRRRSSSWTQQLHQLPGTGHVPGARPPIDQSSTPILTFAPRRGSRGRGHHPADQGHPRQFARQSDGAGRVIRRAAIWPGSHSSGVLLVSDEIYRSFCYDQPFASPVSFDENTRWSWMASGKT